MLINFFFYKYRQFEFSSQPVKKFTNKFECPIDYLDNPLMYTNVIWKNISIFELPFWRIEEEEKVSIDPPVDLDCGSKWNEP